MQTATLTLAAAMIALPSGTLFAQSYTLDTYPPSMNANEAFVLDLVHPVVLGSHVLKPGRYQFEPLHIAGGDLPVLSIRRESDSKLIVTTIAPTFKAFAFPASYATFYWIGDKYYFKRIFVQGLNYGYSFEPPKELPRGAAR